MVSPDRKEPVVLPLSPPKESEGNRFAAARKARGLSVQQVANSLNLGTHIINLMEKDGPSELPNNTYTIGYIRAYSRLLGLDSDEAMESISLQPEEQANGLTAYGATVEVIRDSGRRDKDRKIVLKVVLLLILIIAALVYGLIQWPVFEDVGLFGFFEQFSIW